MPIADKEFRDPELYTFGYIKWRRTIAKDHEILDRVVPKLTLEEAQAALDSTAAGFALELLNPDGSQSDFHFARGLLLGHISKLKNTSSWKP